MTEEELKAKQAADALAAKEKADAEAKAGSIDYEAEYAALLDQNSKLLTERENFKKGMLSAKAKLKGKDKDGNEVEIETPSEEIDKMIEDKISNKLSSFQTSVASQTIDAAIATKTSNQALQKLIKYHFEHSTQGEDIGERIDNALAIANKKLISKQVTELETAQRNRSQISGGTGTGGGSAPFESKNSNWSTEQLAYFKQRGLNPDKVWENYSKYKN